MPNPIGFGGQGSASHIQMRDFENLARGGKVQFRAGIEGGQISQDVRTGYFESANHSSFSFSRSTVSKELNKVTIKAFIATVRFEKGQAAAQVAEKNLASHLKHGKPLSEHAISSTLTAINKAGVGNKHVLWLGILNGAVIDKTARPTPASLMDAYQPGSSHLKIVEQQRWQHPENIEGKIVSTARARSLVSLSTSTQQKTFLANFAKEQISHTGRALGSVTFPVDIRISIERQEIVDALLVPYEGKSLSVSELNFLKEQITVIGQLYRELANVSHFQHFNNFKEMILEQLADEEPLDHNAILEHSLFH